MIFNVDCHFHPNLPNNNRRALKKCEKWWAAFKKNKINAVIVTEHVFKNPKRAYRLMKQTEPEDCVAFPGMEYNTKEGVDIVIFSDKEQIYDYDELRPYNLSYEDTIDFVLANDLHAYVTHPHTIGFTSVIKKLGYDVYRKSVDKLGAVEIVNMSCFDLYKLLDRFPFKYLFSGMLDSLKKVMFLPKNEYPKKVKFLAVGSDAHLFEEIRAYVRISASKENLFERLVSNPNPKIGYTKEKKMNFWLMIKSSITTINEFLLKRL